MRVTTSRPLFRVPIAHCIGFGALASLLGIASSAMSTSSLTITSPAQGATFSGTEVTVTIEASEVTLGPPPRATKKDDFHVIYALDIDTKPFLEGRTKLGSGADRVHTARTSDTFKEVPPGAHNVDVILVYSDHTAVGPPVTA